MTALSIVLTGCGASRRASFPTYSVTDVEHAFQRAQVRLANLTSGPGKATRWAFFLGRFDVAVSRLPTVAAARAEYRAQLGDFAHDRSPHRLMKNVYVIALPNVRPKGRSIPAMPHALAQALQYLAGGG